MIVILQRAAHGPVFVLGMTVTFADTEALYFAQYLKRYILLGRRLRGRDSVEVCSEGTK